MKSQAGVSCFAFKYLIDTKVLKYLAESDSELNGKKKVEVNNKYISVVDFRYPHNSLLALPDGVTRKVRMLLLEFIIQQCKNLKQVL